jgi:DNA helicase-2/ATP-dependent DNA helicase PcrA
VGKEEALNVGDRVNHKVFGEGLVLETSGQGDKQSVVVSFSSDRSQRKLLLKYANLTRVERTEKGTGLS